MKTYTREEAIEMMLNGKQMTSDEFKNPDVEYCTYDKNAFLPFRFIDATQNVSMELSLGIKVWRKRKYVPKDKELVWTYSNYDITYATLNYYDAINNATFDYAGDRNGECYDNYSPFDGTPPPNMCKPEDLED